MNSFPTALRAVLRAVLPALVLAVPTLANAQGPSKTMSKPEAEFAEPFTSVVAIRELRDGRVIVADSRDKLVQVVNLKTQQSAKVGREGSGPGEYGLPMQMFALPGDSSVVFDMLNSRYLTIQPDAKAGATFRIGDEQTTTTTSGGGTQVRMGGMIMLMPRAADASGNLYFEGSPVTFGPEGPVPADSVPIMRYSRSTKKYDTLTYIQLPKNSAQVQTSGSANNRNVNVRIGAQTPFAMRDTWTALPNGTVAVVRVKDYHLEMVAPNKQRVNGPAIAYTPVRVGEAEKTEYREQQKSSPRIGISRTVEQGGSGAARTSTSASAMPAEEPAEWPAVKPAFSSVIAAPNGDVWVARSRSAKDDIPRYDVFSSTGRLTGQVLLPKKTRVVGFGAGGAVYTVRTDEDDLQYLQRFRG